VICHSLFINDFTACLTGAAAQALKEMSDVVEEKLKKMLPVNVRNYHKRRSSVNFGGKTFLPENICMKN